MRAARNSNERGSVLVSVVAAMLVLLLVGVALSELFSAQRLAGALSVESARAYWIADAGVWHAASVAVDITTPVAFAGGQYTVAKSGSTYTSTGTLHDARRVVALTFP